MADESRDKQEPQHTAATVDDLMQEEPQPKLATAELRAILEALIFASPEPLTPKQIYKLLDTEPKEDVQAALAELKQIYERPGGLQLVEVAGGYQIVTRPDLHEWVRRLFHEHSTQKLTVQALETLAVIAYRQPVTRAEVEAIRGVNCDQTIYTLMQRRLIEERGRREAPGRPILYGTTWEFLECFGLSSLDQLPRALTPEGAIPGGETAPAGDPSAT